MRIAILIAELVRQGGGERQALCLARELQDMGHEAVLYTTEYRPDSCYPDLTKDLRIVASGRHALRRLGIPMPDKLALYLDMMQLARKVEPGFDVINPHAWPAHWAAVRAAKLAPPPVPPVVWMCNDYMWKYWRTQGRWAGSRQMLRRVFYRYDRRVTRRVGRTVVLDEQVQRDVEAGYGIAADVVRSGTDVERLQLPPDSSPREVRERHGISDGSFLLLFLGILMPHRRLEDALEAVGRLVGEGRDVHFLIVGSPDFNPGYAASIREHVTRLGLEKNVTFTGAVSEADVPSYFHACDAFVFPNDPQTWGLAVTEAMACGKPVIVSTGSGVHEVLTDGQTALLFPPRRPDLLAGQIATLMDNPSFAESIASRGREFVANTLTWRNYAAAMVDVFEAGIKERALVARAPVVRLAFAPLKKTFALLKTLSLRLRELVALRLGSADAGHRVRTGHVFSALNQLFPNGRSILDAGCGTGSYAIRCALTYPNSDIVGCDLDESAVKQAQARGDALGLQALTFQRANLTTDLGQDRYDIILCVDVLEHIESVGLALAAMQRALRPGGHLVIHVPATPQRRFLPWLRSWHQHDHVREGFDLASFRTLLTASGLSVDSSKATFGWAGVLAWDVYQTLRSVARPLSLFAFPIVAAAAFLDGHTSTTRGNALLVIAHKSKNKPDEPVGQEQRKLAEVNG